MYTRAKRRTLHIWVAIMAVVFSVLAPSISRALASPSYARDSYQAEICTAVGYKAASVPAGDEKQRPVPFGQAMEQCAFCATHGGSTGLQPPMSMSFNVIDGHDLYLSLFNVAPDAMQFWTAANPRAPPTNV